MEECSVLIETTKSAEDKTSRWFDLPLSLIHISEPTRRTPISYAVFCLKKKLTKINPRPNVILLFSSMY